MSSRNVWVCITAIGNHHYHDAAKITLRSVLRNCPFPVFLGVDTPERPYWAEHPRVITELLPQWDSVLGRPAFLAKFTTLSRLVAQHPDAYILQLDADTLLVDELSCKDIRNQLRDHPFAMLEQTTIKGSSNDRNFFLNHYINHTMVWFGGNTKAPPVEKFQYFNSGVVLSTGPIMLTFLEWCTSVIERKPNHHRVGRHMIADQDYFQYWLNTLHPGQCNTLPWYWNHCEHWHDSFPKPGTLICHFSNFCNGPDIDTVNRMHALLESGLPAP
ncbi:MAG TPA: hypothetical protein ENI62_03730 [Gammaproteobacteria bacterium]|nr:hypothetical protein [Gammaproteobacteria bacterium]